MHKGSHQWTKEKEGMFFGFEFAALLGASPGSSTAVAIMLDLLEKCFPEKVQTKEWQAKLKTMIPTNKLSLVDDKELVQRTRARTSEVLELNR